MANMTANCDGKPHGHNIDHVGPVHSVGAYGADPVGKIASTSGMGGMYLMAMVARCDGGVKETSIVSCIGKGDVSSHGEVTYCLDA